MRLKFILHIEVSSVMRVEYYFMCLKHSFALLIHYRRKSKASFIKRCVTSWNGDLANLPMVFPSTEVWRNMSFVENWESCDSEDISLSMVMFEWSMLHDASSFNYSWEGLGAMISGTAAFCSYLLIDPDIPGCWKKEDSCEGDDGVTYVHCVVLLPCGNWM